MTVTLGSGTARDREIGPVSLRERAQDKLRHNQIQEYGVLDRPPAHDLVSLAELAAQICDMPLAAISLITETDVHQVATAGFEPMTCAREGSLCNMALTQSEPLAVTDISQDPRFAHNRFVNGEVFSIRGYATSQLVTSDGLPVGALSVAAFQPRTLTARQQAALATLADRVMDVFELGLRTRQLEASLKTLHRSNEQLAVFAGQVSHDLRTPLTGVLGYAKLLADRPNIAQDKEAAWLLDRAIASGERMHVLIEDLLDYAQVGGGLGSEDIDLTRLAHEVVADLGPQLDVAGAQVVVHELPTVRGDEAQLRALLQNLVANSAKFTRPGVPPQITITSRRVGDRLRIVVVDNGTGVHADRLPTVFDLLARGAQASVEGSGIGLATCKRIVEAHGGKIGLESWSECGTLVWFELRS